jgi:hypothetical protein
MQKSQYVFLSLPFSAVKSKKKKGLYHQMAFVEIVALKVVKFRIAGEKVRRFTFNRISGTI